MPRQPTANETTKVSRFTRQLLAINADINLALRGTKHLDIDTINTVIDRLNTYLAEETDEVLCNGPYMHCLLEQCARYNRYIGQYQLGEDIFVNKGPQELHAIESEDYALSPASGFIVTTQRNLERFRPPHVAQSSKGNLFFYCEADAQTYIQRYKDANAKLVVETQSSNVQSKLSLFSKKITKLDATKQLIESKHSYFSAATAQHHSESKESYRAFHYAVQQGQWLADSMLKHWNGTDAFYRVPKRYTEDEPPRVTHIGHATALFEAGPFKLVTDPVHYQSGTKGLLGAGGKVLYPRNTDPALMPTQYPDVQAVWISHNHYDHLCEKSLKESFTPNTLFIVPEGDKHLLQQWGFKHIIELGRWNEQVDIKDLDSDAVLKIHSIPAYHASNRSLDDTMQSSYMGCILEYVAKNGKRTCVYITGDTAVLDAEHFEQLDTFLKTNELRIDMACLAAGPDRPRSLMALSHQSSADAIALHVRLMMSNLRKNTSCELNQLIEKAPQSIAYHQGCFRLGLLRYHDAAKTLNRLLSVLLNHESLHPDKNSVTDFLAQIASPTYKNIHFTMMADFEREAMCTLLNLVSELKIDDEDGFGGTHPIRVSEVASLIAATYRLPKIGDVLNAELNPATLAQKDTPWSENELLQNLFNLTGQRFPTTHDMFIHAVWTYINTEGNLKTQKKLLAHIDTVTFKEACIAIDKNAGTFKRARQLNALLCELYDEIHEGQRFDETLNTDMRFECLLLAVAHAAQHTDEILLSGQAEMLY